MKKIRTILAFFVLILVLSLGVFQGVRLIRGTGQKTIRIEKRISEKKKKNKKKKKKNASSVTPTAAPAQNSSAVQNADAGAAGQQGEKEQAADTAGVTEDGTYTEKDDVAAYIHEFGHLPSNFITKKDAQALGWDSRAGNLDEVAPGKSIGGDYFGNYEGKLPTKKGRTYHECDIGYDGGYRSSARIIYSDDGLVYYTEDHYNTFEQLY